ncbi:hypothetical protein OG897_32570 [Streptomyces sp. NBC_00237]|uniref:hypothetical protein n=1 Tax=Streptomyces sp. NBC_00237 TaxID=2975687 RepID=UPI0022553021|nr:hypothetical protein [Streptomyces sp. NBC_00237]MCX5206129.1 hypothetical protein [Streptomyces sp. NBC_00237]
MSWDGLDPDEGPRSLCGLAELSFGTRDGLWPIAGTGRGETIFLVAANATALWLLTEAWRAPTPPPSPPARYGCAVFR